jgi:type II secretory pathway pseudopilin PulG
MTSAVLSIAAAIIVYYLKSKLKQAENEREQLKDTLHAIDSAIADGDEVGVNAMLDDALRLRDASHRDPGGQDRREA